MLLCLSIGLSAAMWDTITNTSHIYDIGSHEGRIIFSTWGGVVELDPVSDTNPTAYELYRTWTTGDGILSNDVRHVVSIGDKIWLSCADSISVVNPAGIQSFGFGSAYPSLEITGIKELGSRILVSTTIGLAEYYYLPGVNFPLLLHLYNSANTSGGMLSDHISSMQLVNDYLFLASENGISYVHQDSLDVDTSWRSWTSADIPFSLGSPIKLASNSGSLMLQTGLTIWVSDAGVPFNNGWAAYYTSGLLDISAIALDEQNRPWVAYGKWNEDLSAFSTTGNILISRFESDGTQTQFYKDQGGLGNKTITAIRFIDGKTYLGSWGNGFYQEYQDSFSQVITNSIAFPKITEIATDQDSNMWFVSGYINPLPVKKGSLGISFLDDGVWETRTVENSPLHNDSAHSLTVDANNRVWFGAWDVGINNPQGWAHGITIYDLDEDKWWYLNSSGMREWDPDAEVYGPLLPGKAALSGNTIGGLDTDKHGNVFVATYDRGYNVIAPDYTLLGQFTIPSSTHQRVIYSYHDGERYFFGTNNDPGLAIWNDSSIPTTGGSHWVNIPVPELRNCVIYGVATINTRYEGTQHWIAASNGLYMWDGGSGWYRYDTSIKRYRYNTITMSWAQDQLYYVDEERLYGSVRTLPASLYLDPFGRVWIGSLSAGVTMYDPDTDRFTNYYLPKNPLVSNYVTALGYEPVQGLLYIGTPDGLNTLKIGRYIKPETNLEQVKAFPNPFRPERDGSVSIVNLPADSMPQGDNRCRIYDSSGAIVIELWENEFARFEWDGKSAGGSNVSSGIYFFVVTDSQGNTKRGKIAIIR